MSVPSDAAIEQIDALLKQIEPKISLPSSRTTMATGEWFKGTTREAREMRVRAVAAIERLAPGNSVYATQARDLDKSSKADGWIVARLAGVLRALRIDIEAGYMRTVEELVHADVFADFIEMAEELVSKEFKDAAAVITGSVLEEHLRKLARKEGIATERSGKPIKADTLNAELVKAGTYNKVKQKQVTYWLGVRNDAAHGNYDQYDRKQVEEMIRAVRDFLDQMPA